MLSTRTAVEIAFGSKVIVALCNIRFTVASCTPACPASVFCTNDWQAAQVIPVTGMVTRSNRPEGTAAALAAASSIFKVLDIRIYLRTNSSDSCSDLLRNSRREADAVDGGGDLLSGCLLRVERQLRRTDLHRTHRNSGDGLQCIGHTPDAGSAVHSFNR